jgi:hypothetical protein
VPLTTYGRQKLGDHSIGKAAFTMPTGVFAGLFASSPGDAGSQTSEFTGGSYARQALTASLSAFDATGISTLTADVVFPTPTANWGTLAYIGVLDASSAGNMIYYEAVPTPRSVLSNSRRVTLATGQFQIRLT